MTRKSIILMLFCALASMQAVAQDSFEEFRKKANSDFNKFAEDQQREFDEFRKRVNDEYSQMVEKAWREFRAMKGEPKPKEEKPDPPVLYDIKTPKPIAPKPVPIDVVITPPTPKQQPKPIAPIAPAPAPQPAAEKYFSFTYFGTQLKVRIDEDEKISLGSTNERSVAAAWKELSDGRLDKTAADCLDLRSKHNLSDWAYLMMLDKLGQAFYKGRPSEATLTTAWLYCQSGYQMKLAEGNGRIYMLYGSEYTIFGECYWTIDNTKYYPLNCKLEQLHICSATFPKEQGLSLEMTKPVNLAQADSPSRKVQSKGYADVVTTTNVNKNVISLMDTYPTGMINNETCSRWALYANTPLCPEAQATLYPALRKAINGMTQSNAVGRILNWVQTGFVYEYDDKVWGHDRAFFPDETLYYPYCDCEDRSILFTRIVRDLVGLDCLLIYYPGHLASAVAFTDNVQGDYISIGGQRFIVCDPTYIGAPVGMTMPKMDNKSAQVIILNGN